MKKQLQIIIGRHSYKVYVKDPMLLKFIYRFNKQFQTFKKEYIKRKVTIVKDKLYIATNEIHREYYYPSNTLRDFALALRLAGLGTNDIEIIYKQKPKRFKIDLDFIFKHKLRDYQNKYVRTMTKSLIKNHTFLVDLATGKGKTTIACKTIKKLGYRTAILILPKYISKWVGDLKEHFDITDDDIFLVKGKDSLIELMNMPEEDIPKFIILSNRTVYFYIKEYETLQFKNMFNYPVLPNDLLDKLNTSILLVDETHQEFHSVYKTTLMLDPTLLIGLSATLIHKNKKMNELYELLYPNETRLSFLEIDRYQYVTAVRYTLPMPKNFKYVAGSYGYSQTKFEESLLKFYNSLGIFTKMLLKYLEEQYISRRKNNQKCLIFFGSVDMCTHMSELLQKKYPDLYVVKYTSGDSYDEMMESDIIVSTPGSSGTALDIKNLITVLSPYNTKSVQLNLQMLGRLRKIDDVKVMFTYFYCGQIEQHVKYHHERLELFSDRVARIDQLMYLDIK